MNKQNLLMNPIVIWLRLGIRMSLFALALLWPAETGWFVRLHAFVRLTPHFAARARFNLRTRRIIYLLE